MGRKRKGTKPPPRVLRNVHDQKAGVQYVQRRHPLPDGVAEVSRLGTVWQHFPHEPDQIVSSIDFKTDVVFFCDSTLFLAPTDSAVWNTLFRHNNIVLAPPIIDELQWWLADPKGINLEAHRHVAALLKGDQAAPMSILSRPPTPELESAALYYVNLLGIRKHTLAIARRRLEKKLGRAVTADEVSNYIQQECTPRGQLLSKQGSEPKVPQHVYNDEWLVALAIVYSLVSGKEVTVLTSDEAVLDQFFKLCCLVTFHYLAMALADRYGANPLGFSTCLRENPDRQAFTDDQVLLIDKPPSERVLELLPPAGRMVMMHCMLLQDNVTRVTFNADRDIRKLLDTKGRTGGRNTERFADKNCHCFLSQTAMNRVGDKAVIAHDCRAEIGNTGIYLNPVDLELSLLSREALVMLKPTALVVPPGFQG